jgi:cell division protein ZapB
VPTYYLITISREDDAMTEMDLQKLEQRVDELIRTVNLLQEENQALRVSQDTLTAERAELIEKTEMARTRVESMITRLKSMESGT